MEDFSKKLEEVHSKLSLTEKDNQSLKKKLERAECQLVKAYNYNEDLRIQIDELSKKLAHFKCRKVHVSTQTEENKLTSNNLANQVYNNWIEEASAQQVSVVESITAAAQEALQEIGLVYDESSQMYYDYKSGYYYNEDRSFYYDPTTCVYYVYDHQSGSYKFHSQVAQTEKPVKEKKRKKKPNELLDQVISQDSKEIETKDSCKGDEKNAQINEKNAAMETDEKDKLQEKENSFLLMEEGECSESSVSSSDQSSDEEIVEHWPPCIRLMVTTSDVLDIGTLFIVTTMGATIGQEENNDIIIPEPKVSKHHAIFKFDDSSWQYFIKDLGSQNGTLLNNSRLSESRYESDLHPIQHGDEIVIVNTKLTLHIHDNNDTCDNCEPGLVQASNTTQKNKEINIMNKEEKEMLRRQELKQIKKKFGLENNYEDIPHSKKYKDRAAHRRYIKGSDNPHQIIHNDAASVKKPITSDNVGFKMMEKMGWSSGKGLGKDATGRINPIEVGIRSELSGLGHSVTVSIDNQDSLSKINILNKTKERYFGKTTGITWVAEETSSLDS